MSTRAARSTVLGDALSGRAAPRRDNQGSTEMTCFIGGLQLTDNSDDVAFSMPSSAGQSLRTSPSTRFLTVLKGAGSMSAPIWHGRQNSGGGVKGESNSISMMMTNTKPSAGTGTRYFCGPIISRTENPSVRDVHKRMPECRRSCDRMACTGRRCVSACKLACDDPIRFRERLRVTIQALGWRPGMDGICR